MAKTWLSGSTMVCRHLPDVTCQCWMHPSAFAVSSTFRVLVDALAGRNRIAVDGRPLSDVVSW